MELWDAYYPDGTLAGTTLVRGEPIPPEYRHTVTEVLVVHRDGTILLMQRDHRKPIHPGTWESSAGGSALQGEDFETCARRELREETGLIVEHMGTIMRNMFMKRLVFVKPMWWTKTASMRSIWWRNYVKAVPSDK